MLGSASINLAFFHACIARNNILIHDSCFPCKTSRHNFPLDIFLLLEKSISPRFHSPFKNCTTPDLALPMTQKLVPPIPNAELDFHFDHFRQKHKLYLYLLCLFFNAFIDMRLDSLHYVVYCADSGFILLMSFLHENFLINSTQSQSR